MLECHRKLCFDLLLSSRWIDINRWKDSKEVFKKVKKKERGRIKPLERGSLA